MLNALRESGLIPEEHFVRPQLMYFQRAARTDKSVSAIRQSISIKIVESITTRMSEVNNHLPEDIRLMGCKKVTPSFDAKNHCDGRTYSYLMPSFALCPLTETCQENYRVTKEIINLFNTTLQGYVGTHVFHNFTSGKSFKEDSSTRVIRYMNCSEPFFPCNQKELEFVVVRVKGQSFMMHQIRKMIGLAIAVVRGFATEDHLKRSMEEPFMDIPKAPGLGLMLEEVHYDRYNRKFGGDGQHVPIEWEAQNEAIDEFKDKYIYPVVVEAEIKERSMFNWLDTLSLHTYGDKPSDNLKYNSEKKPLALSKLHSDTSEHTTQEIDASNPKKKFKTNDESQTKEDEINTTLKRAA